ncbi:hypothetical protein G6Z94_11715 [Vibrio aestuarianus]|uniref:hypothetical protein n=1 Tax=Vibrio aestuarianus TaxID=28171 RepID=UPI001592B7D5|nr:hypothetical protein [Vibrio aestuarianus]NGZ18006.1 hypothetical protein [Vibrio aestuarianus]
MAKKFNPYTPAITATQKAIKLRQDKIAEQSELEDYFMGEKRSQLLIDIGRAEGKVEWYKGSKKKEGEAELARLLKLKKKSETAYSEKATNLLFKYEAEIVELETSLRELNMLKARYEENQGFLKSWREA